MKYWNAQRIRRQKERHKKREEETLRRHRIHEVRNRTYSKGDIRKNARLMLNVLGSALHRRMLARLRSGGAMSVSHLARPFRIMLPAAMRHVHIRERAGLITTEKRGRIRFCVYNPAATRELSAHLVSSNPFDIE